jgi:membrane protein required for colicin V production
MPSYLDLAVLVIVLLSGLLALLRGFTREVLAIFSWVAAAAAAYFLHGYAVEWVKPYVPGNPSLSTGIAAAGVFFVALIVVSVVNVKLSDLILDSKIGALDRTLGFLFGAARGLLLAVVAFMFYGWLVAEDKQPDWVKSSRAKPLLASAGERLREALPEDLDVLVAKLKTKKGKSGADDAPAEPDSDAAKPEPTGATPEKKSEADTPAATTTQFADRDRLDALLPGAGAHKQR